MQLQFTYEIEHELKTLSDKLRYLVHENNAHSNYVDTNIKSENLLYNLSLILAHIILKLNFIERSKSVFESIIKEYNETNKTTLVFEDFEKIEWIRFSTGEVVMPKLIQHFIWEVGYYEGQGKLIDIPIDKNDLIRCLQSYYKRCFENAHLTISKDELEAILTDYAQNKITIDFLVEKGILGRVDLNNKLFYWNGHEYSRCLKNEIASTLWLLVGGEDATISEFRKFFKLIQGAEIWIDYLDNYLNQQHTSKICELAAEFLNNENDLLKSNNEFRKIWLDAENYEHRDIKTEIPIVDFNYDNTSDFLESMNFHKWRFHQSFSYQGTRSFCYTLLRLIIQNEPKLPTPYQNALRIIKDTTRPFLVWTLYQEIPDHFPYIIPYLLTNSELIPTAFKLISKIGINDVLKTSQTNNDKKIEDSCIIENEFWLEMFDFILEKFASTDLDDKEKGVLLASILADLSEKVFTYNRNNKYSDIEHNTLRKRYETVLNRISNQRAKQRNIYPSPLIRPRIIVSVLPHIANFLQKKLSFTPPSHTQFLSLESATTDLSVEILRLSNLRFGENETSDKQREEITNSIKQLTISLHNYLSTFYSLTEIEVQTYTTSGVEKRKVKRGINEFGFEIIDWGYIFLHFERNSILQSFHNNFNKTLHFNVIESKYDEENSEQYEKIKLYLKSLMLGFISVTQKKDVYEIEGLPVKSTLAILEGCIKEFSIFYSFDNLSQKQIDVFYEIFSISGYDIYYQHLSTLLYKCINYFTGQDTDKFIENFFASSTDIGRMLTAINIFDSKEHRNIISKQISEIKIDDFIENSFTTTELQYALVEAVNSENHWELAKPLIERIQTHFKRVKHNDEHTNNLLFEVNLLLAFKEKDFYKLNNFSIPQKPYNYPAEDKKLKQKKQFYIALFKLYNDKNYDEAIRLFKLLLSEESKNIRYAFHLYRAETLKAIEIV